MTVDRQRAAAAVRELLVAIGEDPDRPGLERTPERVAEAAEEFFAGVGADPAAHLAADMPAEPGGDVVILRDIAFRSMCEHHLLPFTGRAHVAYLPGERLVGLGKLPAVVATAAARPQVQERLTEQIADALEAGLTPRGVLVVVDAEHGCVRLRGAQQADSSTVTMASRGELREPAQQAVVMGLLREGA